jgi:hypothetical protein
LRPWPCNHVLDELTIFAGKTDAAISGAHAAFSRAHPATPANSIVYKECDGQSG